MAELIPAPDDSGEGQSDDAHADRKSRRENARAGAHRQQRQRSLPTADEILEQLFQLNGAVLLGAVSPRTASIIHRNLKTILDSLAKQSASSATQFAHEDLTDVCRRDPRVLNIIEAFLTVDQLEALLREIEASGDEEA
jgi:hypothetical protein